MQKKLPQQSYKRAFFSKVAKISLIILLGSIGVFVIIGYFLGIRKELFDKSPVAFAFSVLGLILFGCTAFLVGIINFKVQLLIKKFQKKQNIFVFLIKLFLILAFLPLCQAVYILKPLEIIKKFKHMGVRGLLKGFGIKPFVIKTISLALVVGIILPIWIDGYAVAGTIIKVSLGYYPEAIFVSGTGSMFPTFPKGEGNDSKELAKQVVSTPGMIRYPNGLVILGKRFFNYELKRGDIVVVENEKIREMTKNMFDEPSGWVKRLIGLPGDSIELRGGIVYLNGEPLREPYTAKSRSTFGEAFLRECLRVVVPDNHIFVMGDNRKGSADSREIGFIEIGAINHVLPLKDQKGDLIKYWRDTAKDFDESSKIKLDKEKYLALLNEKRRESGAKPLKYQPKLELSAAKRGKIILKFDDFSFEATRSGYTMEKAMREADYYNIVWGESYTQGYFEAEELIENQFELPNTRKFLTDKTYQEVGIAEVEGEINGCPTQVIIQHFAGYVPPNYTKEVIESWKTSLSRLKETQPGWARLKEYKEFYERNRQEVDRINEIIAIRLANISTIVAKMDANQWLSAAEQKMIDQDKSLYDEQEAIATRLNSQH